MKYSSKHRELQKVFNFPSKRFAECSIDCLGDYEKIVSGPAYKDFTPRTIAGLKKENIQSALNWLAKELFDYIHSSNKDFEVWHKETCLSFCDRINRCHGRIPYGKAQKIVNMSFKYLFCLNDSQKYSSKFIDCHMALDQYTLEWFIRVVLTKEKHKHISVTRIRETSWSKLECGSNKEEYSYLWFQNEIKNYLKSNNSIYVTEDGEHLSSLLAEFYIWPEMQLHMAMESLYSQGGEAKDFKEKTLNEKIVALRAFLDKIEDKV